MKKPTYYIFSAVLILLAAAGAWKFRAARTPASPLKIYWLIPDGLRAEPDLFKIYEWAAAGELPNIAELMKRGTYGYSIPVFPSHTPVNYATLLTGSSPVTHGVADGPMHVEGKPLNSVSVGGFRSVARKIPAAWSLLEDQGFKVAVISTPGSTPNELKNGLVVRGRWGGVGLDVHAIGFEIGRELNGQTASRKMFFFGPELTRHVAFENAEAKTFKLSAWGAEIPAQLTSDGAVFKIGGQDVKVRTGEWSRWYPIEIGAEALRFQTEVLFHVAALDTKSARVRVLFNNLNRTVAFPAELSDRLNALNGPMVDFVDNYPPQLIHHPEDRGTFLTEMGLSFDWHTRLIGGLLKTEKPAAVIHGIYNPNQMLTSRWWMGYADPAGRDFESATAGEKAAAWKDIKEMYRAVDRMVGEVLKNADENTVIVLSSDHGAIPLRRSVKLNNLLAREGLLKTKPGTNPKDLEVDWKNSRAVYLQMDGIYIHPKGLDGDWKRGEGPEYEALRARIERLLTGLKDTNGTKPVAKVTRWENAESELGLPKDRVADLIVANREGYGWTEELNANKEVFSVPLLAGYKQAVLPGENKGMWTPFIIAGPGVKKGHALERPIAHIDQLPTILKSLSISNPRKMDGRVLEEAFEENK